MKQHPLKSYAWFGLFVLIVSQACATLMGGEALNETPYQYEPGTTATPVPMETGTGQDDPLQVTSLAGVKNAVIQIKAEGTFDEPEIGRNVSIGKFGSGVIINPQGIALTNNHVVTGASALEVWVGGDISQSYQAVVLGASECSDLAVIDIEGEGFPYVAWFDGEIQVGQEVYAAGFPLRDQQYTLTEGIISKSSASSETSLASIDAALEHTARINPGSSGGPLVEAGGKLVGINYSNLSDSDQNVAISRDELQPILEQLRQGKYVEALGVNGSAVSGTVHDREISGVWVRAVAAESPASKLGIQAGDLIYQFEDEILATDGTLKDYCDILRERSAGDPLTVTVIRGDDLSLWIGEVNGSEMAFVRYWEQVGAADSGGIDLGSISDNCKVAETAGYLTCYDDTRVLIIDVPDTWLDFDGSEWVYDGKTRGIAISASPNLEVYAWNKNMPGLFFGASDTFAQWGGYVEFLDIYTPWYRDACDYDGRFKYNDGVYQGRIDHFSNCDGAGGGNAYVLAAVPIDAPTSTMIIISIQLPPGEEETLDHILNSFYVGDM